MTSRPIVHGIEMLRRIPFLCIALLFLVGWSGISPAAQAPPVDKGPWVVRAAYANPRMVTALAAWNEPWEVHPEQGYVVVEVEQTGLERLRAAGFRVTVDEELTAQLHRPQRLLPGQTSGIPGYPCYRTVEETYVTAQAIAAAHPNLATWSAIGNSWEMETAGGLDGYELRVLRLTNAAVPGPKPVLFVMSAIHAREYAPAELNTRFAEYLVDNYGHDPDVTWLLDEHEIHLLLHANPDGRKQAEAGLSWRKNTNNDYCPNTNLRGADLNRNFAFQWGCCGGSSPNPCELTYRGPSAASEPEVQAVQDYVRSLFPDRRADDLNTIAPSTTSGVFVDLHSYSQLVLWSWGFTAAPAPNGLALQTLGRRLAYFNGYTPEQAMTLYPTDGTTDDFAYGELGVAAYTFELGTAFFQDCATFENVILPDNLEALLYAARVARTPYLTPAGPDAVGVVVSPTTAWRGAVVQVTATVDDTRSSTRNGSEPVQPIVDAIYTVDTPPWVTVTLPLTGSLVAADGSFDETAEAVTGSVDTTGLAPGRHMLWVHGQDAAGNWGPVSAAWLTVLTDLDKRLYLPLVARE